MTSDAPALPLPPAPGLDLPPAERRRVELTVACRDADLIPKVDDAGAVRDEGGVRVQVMHEGSRIVEGCYYGHWMTEIIRRLRGHHEPQEERVMHAILERLHADRADRSPVVLELGAFWAYYSIWAMRLLGARAVLVEPDPSNLEAGRANLALNDLDAVLVNAAVGGPHGSRATLECESDGIRRTLPVISVPGLMEDHGLDRIDLLLVDVQGAEVDVLERAAEAVRDGGIRFLVVSTHHHLISGDPLTHQRCVELLEAAGAHIIAEHTVGESYSGDGMVAAATDPADRGLVVPISFARYQDSLFGPLEPELAAASSPRAIAGHVLQAVRDAASELRRDGRLRELGRRLRR